MFAFVVSHNTTILTPFAEPGRHGERVESACERLLKRAQQADRTQAIDQTGGTHVIPGVIPEVEVNPVGCGVWKADYTNETALEPRPFAKNE